MTGNPPSVCLISPGHVASTPRLVKNADALVEAGCRVHVIYGRHYPPAEPLDEEIFAAAGWSHTAVDCRRRLATLPSKLLRLAARRSLARGSEAVALAARAHHEAVQRLAAAAAAFPADLYFGHCLAGLPAAAFAARRRRVPFGFDAEDFHDAETEEAASDPVEARARRLLQSALLPACALFTASSPLAARQYERVYGRRPVSILNVFPLGQRPSEQAPAAPISPARPARAYWFSQTVGPGRGLEEVVAVLGRMRTPVELHLRGFVSADYSSRLQERASAAGLRQPVRFLEPGAPADMARLAAPYDLGLSTELSSPLNRQLCLTNKVFVYLLAGIPQLLSATEAQSALAAELGPAALLAELTDAEAAARRLDEFFSDPVSIAEARRRAWELAAARFCWDREKDLLLREVQRVLPDCKGPRQPLPPC